MNRIKLLSAFILISFLQLSCNPDDGNTNSPTNSIESDFGTSVARDFFGQIVDENNQPVSGATVIIGNATKQTDANGIFIIDDASVLQKFAFVKVSKAGYLNGSRSLVPTSGQNNVKIMLLTANVLAVVDAGQSSEVALPNGTKVQFDGNFETESGAQYSGSVSVMMHHLDAGDPEISDKMPGMLLAQNEAGDAGMLETYGMVNVKLQGMNGEPLQLSGMAEIRMPVSSSQPNAPTTMPLWHFDEVAGYWKEQGQAVKQGNFYVGEVSHFSWWNFDVYFPSASLTVTVVDTNGNAVPNAGIQFLAGEGINASNVSVTDSNGQVSGLVPAGQVLTIAVVAYGNCNGTTLYTATVGPFETDTVLPNIVVDNSNFTPVTVKGSLLLCNYVPVTNGYVALQNGDQSLFVLVHNGTFSFNTLICSEASQNFILEGYDYLSGQSTGEINYTFTAPVTEIGNLSACDATMEFFSYQIDDHEPVYISNDINAGSLNGGFYVSSVVGQYIHNLTGTSTIPGAFTTPNFTIGGNVIMMNDNVENDIVMQLSSFGNVGEYIDLTFNGTYIGTNGLHTVTGVVHVLRDN